MERCAFHALTPCHPEAELSRLCPWCADTETLADEAMGYLDAVAVFRALDADPCPHEEYEPESVPVPAFELACLAAPRRGDLTFAGKHTPTVAVAGAVPDFEKKYDRKPTRSEKATAAQVLRCWSRNAARDTPTSR